MTIPCEAVPELKWHLSVGIAIGILGFLGVVVPLIRDKQWKRWEKDEKPWRRWEVAGWTACCFVLLVFELHSIGEQEEHQRLQQVNDACVQQNRFDDTVGKLDTSIKQAQKAAEESKEAVDTVTGGDTFPYMDFGDPSLQYATSHKVGKFPLRNIHVEITDSSECGTDEGFGCKYTQYLGRKTIPEINPGSFVRGAEGRFYIKDLEGDGKSPLSTHPTHLTINLSADNGEWIEYFWVYTHTPPFRMEQYDRAIRIYELLYDSQGTRNGRNLIWECQSKDFPKESLGFDLVNDPNVRMYGVPIHIKSLEQGGFKASVIPPTHVRLCNKP